MSSTTYNVLAGLIGALSLSTLAYAQAPAAAAPLDFSKMDVTPKKVADGFYVIDETPAHGGAISVLTGPDGVLMVDTGVAGLAARVEGEIRKLSAGKPIRYVINTHAHVDEIGGNELFARTGATLIGRDQMRYSMLHPRLPTSGGVAATGPGADGRDTRQARPPSVEAAPKITFKTEMTLHLNGQDIRLIAIPKAHTDSDAVIVLPGLDIVVVGDVLRASEYPSIGRPDGGSLPGMLAGLDALLALGGPNTKYVTSHGQIVGKAAVEAQKAMLITSRDRIAVMIKDGKTLDQVVAAKVVEGLGAKAEPGHLGPDAFARDVYNELKAAS